MSQGIPENWKTVRLADTGHLIMGQSPSGSSYNNKGNGLPLLNGAAELRIDKIDVKKYTSLPTRISNKGDLLFCIRATIGNLNVSDKEYCLGRGVAALRVDGEYSKKYIRLQLESLFDQMRKMSQGGVIKGLKKEEIGDFKFLTPVNKYEQEKIANIVISAEESVLKTQKIIDHNEQLKESLIHEFFTRGIGHTKFKQSEIGEIPLNWQVVALKDSSNFIDYRGKTPTKTKSGIPLITAKNVRPGFLSEEPREFIAESNYDGWMTRGIPKFGDILFTTEAPLGNVAQITTTNKIALAQRIIVIQPDSFLNPTFLKYQLLSSRWHKNLDKYGSGGTVTGIKSSILKMIKVVQPPLNEQKKIVEILESIDKQIEVNKELKARQVQLKLGLMQDLLSGKVVI
jgi:type I restriction enzyme S subunit